MTSYDVTMARLVLIAVAGALLACGGLAQAQGPVKQVQAVVRGKALLPCDIHPPLANDNVILVIWYKNEMTPIYSYDARGNRTERPEHWKEKDMVESRAYFRTITEPATLSIDNIEERDEGDYRCRVDFRKSPTRNTKVKLTVMVPPMKPKIIDDRGKELSSVAGPYEEGQELKLTCIVSGGKPQPTVQWWKEQELIESTDVLSPFPNVKENKLVVRRLNRGDLHAKYTCQASNNKINPPVSASVSIEMHFKPISASILISGQPLSADRQYNLVCQAVGSRPPAKITWWKDNKQLGDSFETISGDGNITTSNITFTPTMVDHDKSLTCRADNKHVQAGVEEDTWKLNVLFVPVVHLELGSSLNPNDIEEGDDVYFECKVHANPAAYKVIWKHNGQLVAQNLKNGVIMSNRDLALQGVRRHQAGNYTCTASNIEGDGDSNTVQLRVMYKPICKSDQKRVYGVARHENANVVCEVEAYPLPVTFKWSFNNTAETIDVPQAHYQNDFSRTTLTYKPVTEMDYGTVMCWASNTAGTQKEPCVFHIIAAGRPDTPYNCTIVNQTTDSVEVECLEGFDGGQQQYFLLEVYDLSTGLLQSNVTARFPVFIVNGLESGKGLKMLVYSANAKGKSEQPAVLEGFTLKVAEKQTGTPVVFEFSSMLGVLVSVVVALFLAGMVAVAAMRLRSHRSPGHTIGDHPIKEKVTIPLRAEDPYEKDDKNPDVIPCNKDSDYQLVTGLQPNSNPTPESPYDEPTIRGSNGPARNGDLYENFKSNGRYPASGAAMPTDEEVTYAELCLARPGLEPANGTLKSNTGTLPLVRGRDEPTIYAQIDHTARRGGGGGTTITSPLQSPLSPLEGPPGREIVTVRTPLMANQQESCV